MKILVIERAVVMKTGACVRSEPQLSGAEGGDGRQLQYRSVSWTSGCAVG